MYTNTLYVYKKIKTQTRCPVYTDSKVFGKSPSKKRAGGSPSVNVVYLWNTFVGVYLAINNYVDKDKLVNYIRSIRIENVFIYVLYIFFNRDKPLLPYFLRLHEPLSYA